MDSIKSQLMDMGFHEAKVKRAMESCPDAKTLEPLMDWLIAHEDELNTEPSNNPGSATKVAKVESNRSNDQLKASSSSSKSADATKIASSDNAEGESNETAANMAARKKITVEEAQRFITERQAKRAEEERKKEIEDEKKRRIAGQKMAQTRAELQDQERIHLAQQIRREKLEKELHKKQLLEQIARDREAYKIKNSPATSTSTAATSSCPAPVKSQPRASASECKIALRFPDGSNLMHKFSPKEQLAAVKLYVQMEKGIAGDVEFIAPPNKKLNGSMMDQTLENLGLCPASRLEVKFKMTDWSDMD